MKKIPLLIAFLLLSGMVVAQERAITSTGDEVILYQNGTWTYVSENSSNINEITINPRIYSRPISSTFLLKSKVLDVGFWINPTKWQFEKASLNEDAEYELKLRNGELYATIITEKTQVPLESMRFLAIENAKNIAPDIRVVKEEFRKVNGKTVLMLQMSFTRYGIKFASHSYYFSNEDGAVQFITSTSQSIADSYLNEIEDLLNGLVVLKPYEGTQEGLGKMAYERDNEIIIAKIEKPELIQGVDEEIFNFASVETFPIFPGCENLPTKDEKFRCLNENIMKHISNNFEFPEEARQKGIQGRIYVNFVIDKQGKVRGVWVVRGVDESIDNEAIRVIKLLPKFTPATQRGKPVSMQYTVPINARLQ